MDSLARAGFTGAVLVQAPDGVLVSSGYGDLETGSDVPVTDSTLFYIASLSKQFTGAAVLLAAREGLLTLDGRVGDYLEDAPADKAAISVRQLLAHSSGLPEYIGGWRESITASEARRRILTSELRFHPGREYAYSNAGYTLLALILEEVAGNGFPDYLRTRVLEPLGMNDTYVLGDSAPAGLIGARGRVEGEEENWSPRDWEGPGWSHLGAGGVVSTLRDMRAWVSALTSCSPLPRDVCRQMREPLIETRAGWYAAGLRTTDSSYGGPLVYHFGSEANGHNAALMWFPEHRLTVVVLSNYSTLERGYASATAISLARYELNPGEDHPPFYAEAAASE